MLSASSCTDGMNDESRHIPDTWQQDYTAAAIHQYLPTVTHIEGVLTDANPCNHLHTDLATTGVNRENIHGVKQKGR